MKDLYFVGAVILITLAIDNVNNYLIIGILMLTYYFWSDYKEKQEDKFLDEMLKEIIKERKMIKEKEK